MGQLDHLRQAAISPDSFVTSSSDSSSSLNSQIQSYTPSSLRYNSNTSSILSTPRQTISDHALPCKSPSKLSSSIKSSSQSSYVPSQMIHSYTLNSLEPRPLKPFKSRSAYIDAMKEDLAEWLNSIYSDLELTPDNFFSQLETGAIICRHANNVTQMGRNLMMEQSTTSSEGGSGSDNENISMNHDCSLTSQQKDNSLNCSSPENGTGVERSRAEYPNKGISNFMRRHRNSTTNSSNSSLSTTTSSSTSRQRLSLTGPISSTIGSARSMGDKGIDWFRVKVISYKSDARPGTFFARDNICQFILWCRSLRILDCLLFETDDLVSRKNEKSFILCLLEVARIGFKVGMPTPLIIQLEQEIDREIENDAKLQKQLEDNRVSDVQLEKQLSADSPPNYSQSEDHYKVSDVNQSSTTNDALEQDANELNNNCKDVEREKSPDKTVEPSGEIAAQLSEEEDYSADFGPKPQLVLNDLMNLHERVS